MKYFPPGRKWSLTPDDYFWAYALELANNLEAANPTDARIAPLREFGNNHVFVDHEDAFRELGRYFFARERGSWDINYKECVFPAPISS